MILANHLIKAKGRTSPFNFGEVIFIHGLGSSALMWEKAAEFLASKGLTCHRLEFRGHGSSAEEYQETPLELHVNDLKETLARLNMTKPYVFIGHSLGAIVSLELACQDNSDIAGILAVGMPVKVPKITCWGFELFLNTIYPSLKVTKLYKLLPWREKTLIQTNEYSLRQILKNIKDINFFTHSKYADFAQIKLPIHFACGNIDPVAILKDSKEFQKLFPDSSLKVFKIGGHNFMDYKEVEFNTWIFDKLSTISQNL